MAVKILGHESRRTRRLQSGIANGDERAKVRLSLETLEARVVPATIIVTESSGGVLRSASSPTLTIAGSGFNSIGSQDILTFSNGVTGLVSNASSTSLTVNLAGLSGVASATPLTVTVTVDGSSSGSPVQVATAVDYLVGPLAGEYSTLPAAVTADTNGGAIGFDSSLITTGAVTQAVQNASGQPLGTDTYSYTSPSPLSSLVVGQTVSIAGITPIAYDGTFTVSSVGSGTFTVQMGNFNTLATGSSGTGTAYPFLKLSTALTIANSLTITGLGESNLFISGDEVFSNPQVFVISTGKMVGISGLTVENGTNGGGNGGGISNSGTLTLDNITVSGNSANYGGAIYNSGTLTLNSSIISGNTATYGGGGILNTGTLLGYGTVIESNTSNGLPSFNGGGGGIFNNSGNVTLIGDQLLGNLAKTAIGGGIFNGGGTLTLNNSTVSGNTATGTPRSSDYSYAGAGAGIYDNRTATLKASYDQFENSSGSRNANGVGSGGVAISNAGGTLSVIDSTFTGNNGGGISNNYGTATIEGSTFAYNSSTNPGGAILTYGGSLTLIDSTLYKNSSSDNSDGGGGGFADINATASLSNDTITGNGAIDGGGINNNSSSLVLQDSIVSGNTLTKAGGHGSDIFTPYGNTYAYDNLIGASTGTVYGSYSNSIGNIQGNAYFASTGLYNNGGPTQTVAILHNSAAIGSGLANNIPGIPAPTTDQRGIAVASSPDAGAFQLETVTSPGASLLVSSSTMVITGSAFDPNAVKDSVSFNNGVTGTVVSATSTSLLVKLTGLSALSAGTTLSANVTVDGVSSGNLVPVATVSATFAVNSVTATPDGIVLLFDGPINPSTTVLYSSPGDTTYGSADITVVGASKDNNVRGSLVIDPTNPAMATFVQTSGLLATDTYTVTVTNTVKAVGGYSLARTFSTTVPVTMPTTPVLSVPSFARGPGQTVALNDSLGNATGIPISINVATLVTQASFTFTYDPLLLTIPSSGALSLSAAASAAFTIQSYTITNIDAYHSVLAINLSGTTGFTSIVGSPLVTILASVPTTATYLDKEVLNLGNVVVNNASATGLSGVAVVAYFGDVQGTGIPNAADASLVNQVAAGAGTGFSAFKDLDPVIIGGIGTIGEAGTSLNVNANDASLINESAAGASAQTTGIPSIPTGVTLVAGGADPYLYLSAVQGAPGQTVTETLYLDVTDPNGIQLTALDEALAFETSALQVSNVRAASGLMSFGSYATGSTVDNGSGVLLVAQAYMGSGVPPEVPYRTVISVLQFDVTSNANSTVGSEGEITLLQYGTVNGNTQYTAISDNDGALTFTPGKVPSNSGNAAIDGSVTVVPATTAAVAVAEQPPVVVSRRTIVSVRRVIPDSRNPVVTETTNPPDTIVSPVSTSVVGATWVLELVPINVSPLVFSVASVQPGANPVIVASPVPAEVLPSANLTPSSTKVTDSGAVLSLVALETNRAAPPGGTSAKSSTSVLDEMYHQLTTVGPQVNVWRLGVSGNDELYDPWNLEPMLEDLDFGVKSME